MSTVGNFGIIIASVCEARNQCLRLCRFLLTGVKQYRERKSDMGKETEHSTHVLRNEKIGQVQIADDVVAMIAGLAALEVDGVASMAGNVTDELLSKVGMKATGRGVKVEVIDRIVSVDIAVNLKYGYNIPAVSEKMQEKVKSAIETMTGLNVADVNVRITGVVMNG